MTHDRHMQLATHAAATLEPDDWRNLVNVARELTRDLMSLDDAPAVALAIARAEAMLKRCPSSAGADCVH